MRLDLSPLWISLKTAAAATVITAFLGVWAAWWLVECKWRGKGLIDGIFNLPLVLPPTVVGFLLLAFFGKNGPLGSIMNFLNMHIIFTWAANVIAAVVVSFPMMYKTTRSAFEQISPNYINAAKTLGASQWRIFLKIMLPLSWPGVAAGMILAFARAMGEFGATLMIAGSIRGKTLTMPIAIFFASEGGKDDEAMLWVIIIIGISLAVIFLMNHWLDHQNKFRGRN